MSCAFKMTRRVAFAETDMAGVMHFSNYYRLMEEVEHEFWRSVGMSVHIEHGDCPVSWPRVRTSCEYLKPARFEDVLSLAFRVSAVGAKSASFEVEFSRNDDLLARGQTTAVCCELRGGHFRPIEIPPHVRAKLEAAIVASGS